MTINVAVLRTAGESVPYTLQGRDHKLRKGVCRIGSVSFSRLQLWCATTC